MLEAFAAALLLGGINTIADAISSELRLEAKPIYVFARVMLICYCIGGIVGARARQLMMGSVGGLMLGALVSAVYYLLSEPLGWGALAVAWTCFWLGFSLLDAVLQGGSSAIGAVARGVAAAALAAGFYYAVRNVWSEAPGGEPSLLRAMVSWSTAFLPGFILLFWRKLD